MIFYCHVLLPCGFIRMKWKNWKSLDYNSINALIFNLLPLLHSLLLFLYLPLSFHVFTYLFLFFIHLLFPLLTQSYRMCEFSHDKICMNVVKAEEGIIFFSLMLLLLLRLFYLLPFVMFFSGFIEFILIWKYVCR